MTSPTITIHHLNFDYDNKPLFLDINLTLPGQQITALLGASGSGKSTLLKLIAGLIPSTQGTLTTNDNQPLTGRVGLMTQSDSLLPWLNVLDNVLLFNRLKSRISVADKQQAIEWLKAVGLENRAHAYPHELSGGMRQRVALARTLMDNTPVILLDEPFSAVDALTRQQLQQLTCQMLSHKTVFLVTHDPYEALRMANKIYVLGKNHVLHAIALDSPTPRDIMQACYLPYYHQLLSYL